MTNDEVRERPVGLFAALSSFVIGGALVGHCEAYAASAVGIDDAYPIVALTGGQSAGPLALR